MKPWICTKLTFRYTKGSQSTDHFNIQKIFTIVSVNRHFDICLCIWVSRVSKIQTEGTRRNCFIYRNLLLQLCFSTKLKKFVRQHFVPIWFNLVTQTLVQLFFKMPYIERNFVYIILSSAFFILSILFICLISYYIIITKLLEKMRKPLKTVDQFGIKSFLMQYQSISIFSVVQTNEFERIQIRITDSIFFKHPKYPFQQLNCNIYFGHRTKSLINFRFNLKLI